MKDKRNIDELFKSQLSDFNASPSPEVWDRIEAQLKKKKDRKVIPLWWKVGGVAALLALLLTIGNSLFVSNTDQPIVTKDPTIVNPLDSGDEGDEIIPNTTKEVVTTDSPSEATKEDSDTSTINASPDVLEDQRGTQLTHSEKVQPLKKDASKDIVEELKKSDVGITKTEANAPKQPLKEEPHKKTLPSENIVKQETGLAKVDAPKNEKEVTPSKIVEQPIPSEKVQETGIAEENIEKNQEELEQQTEDKKKSIFDAIEENKKEAIVQSEKNANAGWEVTPNVGPVYYNSLSGGSSIDPMFADNSQTGEVNFSYGIQVAYVVNDRLSVRTGVNNVNVGYATGGIELATGPVAFGLKSVAYDNPGRDVITVFDRGTLPGTVDPNDPYAQLNLKSTTGNAEIRQSITYYEIPLEAKYALVNTRFGVNMIGGFSTLLLGDSEVSVNDAGFRSVLGEANNLNSVSFSTNVGLGFDYKFSKRFKLNIEPIFKYQLNPYSDSSVDFNPFYFGIYSGLSFKF